MIARTAELVKDEKIPGIYEIRDESDRKVFVLFMN
jgi:DNA gyrase subunit A